MVASRGWQKRTLVLSIFLTIFFIEYLWPFPIGLDDIRPHLPQFLDKEVQGVIDRLPPDKKAGLEVPLPELKYQCDFMFKPAPGRGEYNATKWIANYTARDDKFVADIYGAELIMGMTTRVCTVGGDWANAPDPLSMMYHTIDIYKTDNATYAYGLCRQEKADYVFVPHRTLNPGYWVAEEEVNYTKFNDIRYFEPVYVEDNVTIYRVL